MPALELLSGLRMFPHTQCPPYSDGVAPQGDSRLQCPAWLWEPSCCWRCEASLWTRNWSQHLLPRWKVGIKAWLQFVGSQAVLGREQTSGITLKDLFCCLVPEIKHSSTSPLATPAQQSQTCAHPKLHPRHRSLCVLLGKDRGLSALPPGADLAGAPASSSSLNSSLFLLALK